MPRDWVFSTSGSDITGNGTVGTPYATIEKCAAMMASEDTIVGRGGTYKRTGEFLTVPSGGGSWATATTITAYTGEEVILTPYDETTNFGSQPIEFTSGISWVIVKDLILDGLNQSGGKGGAGGLRLSFNGHHFRISNVEMRYHGAAALFTTNAHSNEFLNLNIHHNDHKLSPGDPGYTTRVYGLYCESANNLIQGCQFYANRERGIHLYSGQTWKPDNTQILGNRCYANGWSGILVGTGANVLVANNECYNNGDQSIAGYTGDQRNGIDAWSGANDGTQVLHNTCWGNARHAFAFGPNTRNLTAKNNIFFGSSGSYHAVKIYTGCTVVEFSNNTIYHANSSLRLSNDSGVTITSTNNADPVFVDTATADFTLQAASPCIDIGVTTGVGTDTAGIIRPQGTAPDHGANEYLDDPPATPAAPGLTVALTQTVTPGTLHILNADANDQDENIISGSAYNESGIIGLDFDPSGCTITHKTS